MNHAKIFALYIGCPCIANISYGEVEQPISAKLLGITDKIHIQCFDKYGKAWDQEFVTQYEKVQLILTPLEDISDEDKLQVFMLDYPDSNLSRDRKISAVAIWMEDNNISFQAADFLRSRFYHLPYMGQNLYELGIAVKPEIKPTI